MRNCPRTIGMLLAGAVIVTACAAATAGVRRNDVPDSQHTSLANETRFGAVGQLLLVDGSNTVKARCSGTHIGDGWVVTAAHCFDGSLLPGEFIVGPYGIGSGETIAPADRYDAAVGSAKIATGWDSGNLLGGNDLAVFRLSDDWSDLPVAKLAGPGLNPVDMQATIVGYGKTGIGLDGHNNDENVPTNAAGTKRAGTNAIDLRGGQVGSVQDDGVYLNATGLATSILLSDFDEPDNTNPSLLGEQIPLAMEYAIAPGDSGGALMVQDPDSGEYLLAGVHSFGASVQVVTDDERTIGDTDGFVNSTYGELQGYTEVSPFIDSFIRPETGIPEPTTLAMLSLAGLAVLARRRR